MMQTTQIRQKLHRYIDNGDEKSLKLMFVLAKEYNDDNDFEYEFTTEDIKEFDERREIRLRGESDTYSWEEAKEIITGKKNNIMAYNLSLQTEAILEIQKAFLWYLV